MALACTRVHIRHLLIPHPIVAYPQSIHPPIRLYHRFTLHGHPASCFTSYHATPPPPPLRFPILMHRPPVWRIHSSSDDARWAQNAQSHCEYLKLFHVHFDLNICLYVAAYVSVPFCTYLCVLCRLFIVTVIYRISSTTYCVFVMCWCGMESLLWHRRI